VISEFGLHDLYKPIIIKRHNLFLLPPPLPFDVFYPCREYVEVSNHLFCFVFFTGFVFTPSLILLNMFSTGCVSMKYHTILCKRTLRKNLKPPRDKAPFPNSNFIEQLRNLVDMATSHSSATSTTPSRNSNGRVTSPDTMSSTSQAPVVTPPKRRPHRIYQPAKNSLYDIFQQHSGTALFVRPICWTDLHAQLLGVKWEDAIHLSL
jgi:hypothetical protein